LKRRERAFLFAPEALCLQRTIPQAWIASWGNIVGEARDVLAPDQMSKFGKTIHPRQFMECPAQRN